MLKYIFIFLTALYFGIPFAYEKAIGAETKVITMNGKQWLVIIEPGKEPMLKPLEKPRAKVTKLPFVIHGKTEESTEKPITVSTVKEKPEWQRTTVDESKIIQTCDHLPAGCEMTPEGDCPECKTELVREKKVEVVQKSDFTIFKERTKAGLILSDKVKTTKSNWYLRTYDWMRDTGHPHYICWKVLLTCQHHDPISIEDLYMAKMNSSSCRTVNDFFNFSNPVRSCPKSTILNL